MAFYINPHKPQPNGMVERQK